MYSDQIELKHVSPWQENVRVKSKCFLAELRKKWTEKCERGNERLFPKRASFSELHGGENHSSDARPSYSKDCST